MKQVSQDRIVTAILTLVSGGGATALTGAGLWPFTIGAMLLLLVIVKFSNEQLLRVLKYVLIVVTTIILLLWLLVLFGVWALWRLLT